MKALTIFEDKQFRGEISKVLPQFFPLDKMMRIALTEFRKNPKLQECSPASIKAALLTAAQLGLEVGGIGGKLYFIPYKIKGTHDQYECTPIISYKGMCEMIWRTGKIKTLDADIVRENDHFSAQKGSSAFLDHQIVLRDRGEILGAYAYVVLKEDGFKYDYLSLDEINKIAYVVGQNGQLYPRSNFWRDHFDEMTKKTALRRLFKTLPDIPEFSLVNDMEYSIEQKAYAVLEPLSHEKISDVTD
jgi:recombination protein RecT